MAMTTLYETHATASGGREAGRAVLSEGGLALAMSFPKSMGGNVSGSNPEQLFALGYASCFNQAILVVGREKRADVEKARVHAKVTLGKTDAGGFGLAVDLQVELPGLDRSQAQEIVDRAHQICPYSQATRNNIPVTVSLA